MRLGSLVHHFASTPVYSTLMQGGLRNEVHLWEQEKKKTVWQKCREDLAI